MAITSYVSVIIPVCDDPDGISDTLKSLVNQTYPAQNYEILTIDEGAGSTTRRAVEQIANQSDVLIRSLTEPRPTAGAARNEGIRYAKGEYLFFLDANETVRPDWIAECISQMVELGAQYAGCNIEVIKHNQAFQTATGRHQIASAFNQGYHIEVDHFALTAALLTQRSVFDQVGLFDPRLVSSEDREFGNRVYEAGIELHYFDNITVRHPPRTTLREMAARWVRIGRGKTQVERYHGYDFDWELTDLRTILPNAFPWNLRWWAVDRYPDRNATAWTLSTIIGLFVVQQVIDYAYIVGHLVEQLSPTDR